MNSLRILLLSFFILGLNKIGSTQDELVFNKSYVESEDKWVAFPIDKEGKYNYGFIYIDRMAGLTLELTGKFNIDNLGHYIPETIKDSFNASYKIRLKPNNNKVAFIPSSKFSELKVDAVPDWLDIYKSYTDTTGRLQRWGYYYNDFGMPLKALEYLEPGYKRDPNFKDMAVELAFAYNALEKFDKAIPVLLKAIEMDPKNGYMYKELSYAYFNVGNMEEAEKAALEGIKHYNDNNMKAEIAYNIAYEYFTKKDKKKFDKWATEARKWATSGDRVSKALDYYEQKFKE